MLQREHTGFEYTDGYWAMASEEASFFAYSFVDKKKLHYLFSCLIFIYFLLSLHAPLFFPCSIIRFAQLVFVVLVSPLFHIFRRFINTTGSGAPVVF
jgi:hypothetical protein